MPSAGRKRSGFEVYVPAASQKSGPPAPKVACHCHVEISRRHGRLTGVTSYIDLPASPEKTRTLTINEGPDHGLSPIILDHLEEDLDPRYLNHLENTDGAGVKVEI